MNRITFDYSKINEKETATFELPPEAYFDLEPGEEPKTYSVPKYLQPFQYIDCNVSELIFVKLHIELGSEKRIFKQTFWNKGENFLTERIDSGKEPYRELILTVKIDEKTDTYEVLRLFCGKDMIVPSSHSLISSDDHGREEEYRFDTGLFIDMIKRGKV